MQCYKGCSRTSVTLLECGGRKIGTAGMMWNRAAGILVLESSAGLEPRRLALKVAPTSTIEVDPHCRATLRDAIAVDATPACGYAYLNDAMKPEPTID